jgi:hypothetical protein
MFVRFLPLLVVLVLLLWLASRLGPHWRRDPRVRMLFSAAGLLLLRRFVLRTVLPQLLRAFAVLRIFR